MVQWLRHCAPNARVPDLILGRGTRSCLLQLKIPHVATKTRCNQINQLIKIRYFFKKGMKNRITEMKSLMCRLSSRLDRDEDAAGKLEGKVEEFTQNMVIKKKKD